MEKIKVRFHLKSGKNFGKWQIKSGDLKHYYCPDNYSLEIIGAKLCNRPNQAEQILKGAHKSVCAWIECDDIVVTRNGPKLLSKLSLFQQLFYNPRNCKHWNTSCILNMDGYLIDRIYTEGKSLYIFS
jgi:hypothetical protein